MEDICGGHLFAISEQIGEPKHWPRYMRPIFFMNKLNNVSALKLVTFTLGNGLAPHLLHQWVSVRKVGLDQRKFKADVASVFKSMTLESTSKLIRAYFYFDMVLGEYCFMNGTPRNNISNTYKLSKKEALPTP